MTPLSEKPAGKPVFRGRVWGARRSWEPVRNGVLYCAPACGRGCTWREHQRAHRLAWTLAKRLGRGWRGEVWEQLGWHYRAVRGPIQVIPHRTPRAPITYSTLLGRTPTTGSIPCPLWQTAARRFRDPRAAVAHQIRLALSVWQEMGDAIEAAEGRRA